MKLSEATVCVNMVDCLVCSGKGHFYERRFLDLTGKKKVKVVCDRCKGNKSYQEECGELIATGEESCPSCAGTSLLLLSRIIDNLQKKQSEASEAKERAGHPGKAIENV